MKKVINWFVKSSADGDKISLTVKGLLLGIVPTIIIVTGMASIDINSSDLSLLFSELALVVKYFLGIIASLTTIFGIVRKIWRTITGDHDGI